MSECVLDASALLTLLNEEPGTERVQELLPGSFLGAVNYCEVLAKLIDAGVTKEDAIEIVDLLGIEIIDFDADLARLAAELRTTTKRFGLSLGDRSCLALGIRRGSKIVTADRSWARLRVDAKIEVIR